MNKGRRNELKFLKYKKRLQRFAATSNLFVNREGKYVWNPKTVDLLKENAQNSYRNHSTPCSCYMCSPDKYNRAKLKSELPSIIEHELNYDAGELEFDFSKGIYVHSIEDIKAHYLARDLIEEG